MGAAAQGQVNIICSVQADWCNMMATVYSRTTGTKVNMSMKGSGEALAQLIAEKDNPKTDIWFGGTGDPHLQAAEQGLTLEYKSPLLPQLYPWARKQAEDAKYRTVGVYLGPVGFGFNTELLARKKAQAPKSWADLLKPEYKGEVQMANPASSGTAYTILAGLVQLMGEDAAFDYLKKLNKNVTQYTRSGQAQARSVGKGEVGIGVSFIFGFENERITNKFPVQSVAPCEGTGYEIGGIALVKGARNKEAARRYYDWLMSPEGQQIGARANSLQVPANKTFKPDPRIPTIDNVRLVKYDFEKYGKAAERRRLVDRWVKEVESQPR
jgi:iron(III) transport system substrate-binding protein